ncbi:MAG TPA: ABC transporter substrate-binding protein, partial [Chloroflexota bacterium]|nr:ABC transporter substrate-binding protein [Chloroflexota bacterium]
MSGRDVFLASRRRFLAASGASAVGALLAACSGPPPTSPTSTTAQPGAVGNPTAPAASQATPAAAKPTVAPTVAPAPQPAAPSGLLGGAPQLPVNLPRNQVFVLGQIFRYSVVNNFNLFVPNGPPNPTRQGLIFDTLWYIDQETGEWINSLATDKPSYNADFTEMTVKLRPGVMWSDNVEFSPDDLVFTVKTLMANEGLNWSAVLNLYVKDVVSKGDNTVVFTLTQPNPRFHYNFTANYNAVYMMAKHVWEKVKDVKTFTFFPPVSLGAYLYYKSDPNGFWEVFKRRDDWQKTVPGMLVKKPGPDYIMTSFQGSDTKDVIAVARDTEDGFMDVNYEAFKSLIESTPTARSWYKDFPWAYPNELNVRYFGFNQAQPPYDNKDVRWALALALDIVGLQTQYEGGVTRVTPIQVPATPVAMKLYHLPLEPWLKALSIDLGGGEKFQPYDPDVPKRIADWATKQKYSIPSDAEGLRNLFGMGWWKYAPDVATKLLQKNGFKKDAQGKWQLPDGKPWTISIIVAPDEV